MPVLSENAVARVGYASGGNSMSVRIVGEWARGEIAMVMSASSGPKDYTKNLIAMALESKVKVGDAFGGAVQESIPVDAIRMLCGEFKSSVPFCVFQVRGRWFDCTGKQVRFERADTADGRPDRKIQG
jgi:hypothetical protein